MKRAIIAGRKGVTHTFWKMLTGQAVVFSLALILTFSPWEKEEPSNASGFVDERPAIPAA
jgi:hypothetical protein